jgi:hypothetical protein
MNVIRLAISFALGRATQCLLPVGWKGDTAVWAAWHTGGVDRMRTVQSLLDQSEAVAQLSGIVGGALEFAADPYREEVLQYAISYYLTANHDVNVELAVALAVSALQLISYYRLVEESRSYSNSDWKSLGTRGQIEVILDQLGVDVSVPRHFEHLLQVQSTLGPNEDGTIRTALNCIVKMRNHVIHPTRDKPASWDPYQWAEAAQVALDYVRFAILQLTQYQGGVRTATQESKWLGALTQVPWSSLQGGEATDWHSLRST